MAKRGSGDPRGYRAPSLELPSRAGPLTPACGVLRAAQTPGVGVGEAPEQTPAQGPSPCLPWFRAPAHLESLSPQADWRPHIWKYLLPSVGMELAAPGEEGAAAGAQGLPDVSGLQMC